MIVVDEENRSSKNDEEWIDTNIEVERKRGFVNNERKVSNFQKCIILSILIVIFICLIFGAMCIFQYGILNPTKLDLIMGDKCLGSDKYEEAVAVFSKVIEDDKDNVTAYLGKAKAEIMLNDKESALDTIEHMIMTAAEAKEDSSTKGIEDVIEWWINNADPLSQNFEKIIEKANSIPNVVFICEWSELRYEDTAPYREYRSLKVNGKDTQQKSYTGKCAYVEWKVEGFEKKIPYKEYEIKYINGKKSNKKRYTGRTRPRFDQYTKYFNMSMQSTEDEFPNLKYLSSWWGSYWYRIDDRSMLGFNTTRSGLICGAAAVSLLNIYPDLLDIANTEGIVTKEQFQKYVQSPVQFTDYEGCCLYYSYENFIVWVTCEENQNININDALVIWREEL